ncbi:hypothetical protein P3T76_000397 [Phytophthora citrophthora]|uniref:Uncharacterized protein n=1 Tax=Phytophthora citrophthora TaxID=4793 RepID=A0AAD9H0L0_9STRA|nr:hypothetical protein P3T76_000397 [Phytophthora citrophthora]
MANDPAAVPTLYVWMLFLRRAPAGNYHEELLPHVNRFRCEAIPAGKDMASEFLNGMWFKNSLNHSTAC